MGTDQTYRETALDQAVRSHGRRQVVTSDGVVLDVPGDKDAVARAAEAYERFLDRSPREAEEQAERLAAALRPLAEEADGAPLGTTARAALDQYDAWLDRLKEPF